MVARIDHSDLHGGNALIDAAGKAWAIDFHKARRVKELTPRRLLRDLVRVAAGVREVFSPRFRARFLCAWLAALPDELRAGVLASFESVRELAASVERDARARRAQDVYARRKRWTRASPACRVTTERGIDAVERNDARAGIALEIDALVQRHGAAGELVFELEPSQRVLVLAGRGASELRRAWLAAVRLDEHGIAVARPLCWMRGPRAWAAFELPRGAEPSSRALSLRELRALGRLCAELADRGLRPRAATAHPIWFDARGSALFAGLAQIEFDARIACGVEPVRTLALAGVSLSELNARQRAAFAAGILRGARLGRVAGAALRADLRHG